MENPKLMQTINGVRTSQEPSLSADEDPEISIFDAQRYFNESNNDSRVCKRVSPLDNMPNLQDPLVPRFSSASSAADGYGYGGRTYRVRSFHATPTASSEASWNSQTGLLSNPPGAIPVSMTMKSSDATTTDHKRKGSGKMKWLWGRRCPCSGKKSVQVEPKTPSGPNQNNLNHKREEILLACNPHRISADNQFHNSSFGPRMVSSSATARSLLISGPSSGTGTGFTFPILNQQATTSSSAHAHLKMTVVNRNHSSLDAHDQDQDPPRESLEVFQPKKPVSRFIVTDDDVGSDTSSDLFEIESFTTTTQSQITSNQPYHRRDSLDEASNFNIRRSVHGGTSSGLSCPYSPMTNECYEPSEVSIDWSVTTAEGFERGSVGVSEAEEMNMITAVGGKKKSGGNGGGGGLLSSCRCEKAVSVVVGPNPVKNVSPQGQAANASKHVGNVNKPPLARLSRPFAA